MRYLAVAVLSVSILGLPLSATACPGHAKVEAATYEVNTTPLQTEAPTCMAREQEPPQIKTVTIDEMVQLQKQRKVEVVDVNTSQTRERYGVIPGAILLTSASRFEVAKELPVSKDAGLVFYCANEKCRAAEVAAQRATEGGYTNVGVLRAGIMGWKQAGQKTKTILRT